MYKKLKWFKYFQILSLSALLPTFAGVLGFFASELISEVMPYLPNLELVRTKGNSGVYIVYLILGWIIATLIFLWLLNLAYKITTQIIFSKAKMRLSRNEKKYPVLIIGLSPVREDLLPKVMNDMNFPLEELAKSTEGFKEYIQEKSDKGEKPPFGGPWQQVLRAVNHHHPKIRKLLILPSAESRNQLSSFEKYVKNFFPNLIVETVKDDDNPNKDFFEYDPDIGIMGNSELAEKRDYNSYNYVVGGLEQAIVQSGYKEADICIDATPGIKIFSIGAAIVTLNRSIKFSYVDNNGIVKFYDASVELVNLFK